MKAGSDDEVVRLRTSNAMKRVARENKALLVPYLDAMMKESLCRQKPKKSLAKVTKGQKKK